MPDGDIYMTVSLSGSLGLQLVTEGPLGVMSRSRSGGTVTTRGRSEDGRAGRTAHSLPGSTDQGQTGGVS
jgi:hypothetical protein